MKYIDAEKLKVEIEKRKQVHFDDYFIKKNGSPADYGASNALVQVLSLINSLQQEQTDMGEVSDGYHTFNELYYYRMLYNAAFFNLLPKELVHKSKRHHTGEECFGGGWFIVMANLPTGQISNHYELKDWDLFQVPEKEFADEWDGHTPQEAAERLHRYLMQEKPEVDLEKEITAYIEKHFHIRYDETLEVGNDPLTTIDFCEVARYFYELGQCEMRNRITNPEYNKQVVERMKSEHPIAANEEELKKAIKERYPMPKDADAHTRDRIAAARNGFLSGYSYELGRKARKEK